MNPLHLNSEVGNITIIFNRGTHNIPLESHVRLNWSQTRTFDRALWSVSIDVVLWVVPDVLGSRSTKGRNSLA